MSRKNEQNDFAMQQGGFAKLCCRILNKDGALPSDGFVQVVPKGEHPKRVKNRNGEVIEIIQVVDDVAIESMVKNSTAEFVDWEHYSETSDGATDAAAWFGDYEARTDGVYNRLDWSSKGERDVTGRVLRYLSPVFDPKDMQHLGGNRYRPLKLDGAGLTNKRNMKAIRAIVNKEFLTQPNDNTLEKPTNMNKQLAALLGLEEGASDEVVLDKVKNTIEQAGKVEGLASELEKIKNKQQEAEVEAILDKHSKVVNKDNRERYAKLLNSDRETTEAVLEELTAEKDKGSALDSSKRIHNRDAGAPDGAVVAPAADQQTALVSKIMNRDACNFEQAWETARTENPAIFKQD